MRFDQRGAQVVGMVARMATKVQTHIKFDAGPPEWTLVQFACHAVVKVRCSRQFQAMRYSRPPQRWT